MQKETFRHTLARYGGPISIAIIVILLTLLRLVHLEADTPSGLSWSAGLYVDEGYKTLSARNLINFDTYYWNANDDYVGWERRSPIIHYLYVLAFSLGGTNIKIARAITICFFFFFLVFFCIYLRKYPPWILAIGLLLLGTETFLFFFSRVALLEIPLTAVLYCILFVIRDKREPLRALAILFGLSLLLNFGIKQSALLYLFPIYLATAVTTIYHYRKQLFTVPFMFAFLFLIIIMILVFYSQQDILNKRIVVIPPEKWWRTFSNMPLFKQCFELTLLGTLCAFLSICRSPKALLKDRYRLALIFAVFTPCILPFFKYNPPRYYVPCIPAYALLIVDWLGEINWRIPKSGKLQAIGTAFGGTACLFWILFVVIGLPTTLSIPFFLVAVVTVSVFVACLRYYQHRTISIAVILTIAIGLALIGKNNIIPLKNFIREPTYQARFTRYKLLEIVNGDESIIGDWAPFLTFGTGLRSLYSNKHYNRTSEILKLRANYYLHSRTQECRFSLRWLRNTRGVQLGKPIRLPTYNRSPMLLYPLSYNPKWARFSNGFRVPFEP